MNFNVSADTAFTFAIVGLLWGVVVTLFWWSIALRAVRAHERIAKALDEKLSGR